MKSGFVSIVGRPNVGKSTLLNHFLGTKVAIVSAKPQTTRSCLRGILTIPQKAQLIFVDTPGIHKPLHLLGEYIVNQALQILKEVEWTLMVVDGTVPPGPGDAYVASAIKQAKAPAFLLLNKLDKIPLKERDQHLAAYSALGDFKQVFSISAKHSTNLPAVLDRLVEVLPEGFPLYPEDQLTDQPMSVMAAELIREQVFRRTGEEIPHATAVLIESMTDRTSELTHIAAVIVVERQSQKGILIGKQGKKLGEIGQAARESLELFLGRKVYLELFVKVMPKWRLDRRRLQQLGYQQNL